MLTLICATDREGDASTESAKKIGTMTRPRRMFYSYY